VRAKRSAVLPLPIAPPLSLKCPSHSAACQHHASPREQARQRRGEDTHWGDKRGGGASDERMRRDPFCSALQAGRAPHPSPATPLSPPPCHPSIHTSSGSGSGALNSSFRS